jgi:hypothetical protein
VSFQQCCVLVLALIDVRAIASEPVIAPEHARALHALIAGSRLVVLHYREHVPFVETKAQFLKSVEEFLKHQ